ncbi:MAG: HNH endonuclease [Gammaproteobacteria bacterium]|nr:HNH endonuclease [Gammaproteobacteria bacterium]MBU1556857.1 HNH endonuclease [Gammaproteobacteria bacterium]MBU2071071.1 HNH endonuclease [Gammaproteobacteria bacterium]MBU2184339.1 HNH endonuclease [Gammaproteobacteria bacterium]MBU2206404.1 HNH endonuclease [Gammaproteobacteria bacterium]
MSLQFYLNKFRGLNTMRLQGHNKPHKVCMLLAVMDLIELGVIGENRIEFNDALKQSFTLHFQRLRAGNDQDTPDNPFYHLISEGFWHIQPVVGVELGDITGFSKRKIAYAYLDTELFELMKSSLVRADLRLALTQNLTRLPELYVRWVLGLGKSDRTAKSYLGAVQGVLSDLAKREQITDSDLTQIGSFHEYKRVTTPLYELNEFREKDTRGKRMYSSALKSYGEFLAELGQVDVTTDVDDILQSDDLTTTEKSMLVSARVGQGQFRQRLFEQWDGCAVTGYMMPAMLVASHIKPWRSSSNSERLDPNNGLLLLANLDKAFDRGFISFEDNGQIIISTQLERPQVLGISQQMRLAVREPNIKYLQYHRKLYQERFIA